MIFHLRLDTKLLLLTLAFLITPIPMFAAPADNLVIEHGPRNSHNIALTFDACPTSLPDEYDEKVVDILIKEKVPATIFMSGRWVEKNPDKAKFLAAQPQFEIAAHSYYHPHMTEKPNDRDMREFKRTQEIIKKTTGKTPRYFRPPYCEVNERVVRLASLAGLTTIQYDVASGDPDPKLSPKKIAAGVLQDAKNGSIVIFHMNHKGVHTAEILPKVINGLRKKGFTLVTVGELLGNSESQQTPSTQITNPTPTVPNTSDVGK